MPLKKPNRTHTLTHTHTHKEPTGESLYKLFDSLNTQNETISCDVVTLTFWLLTLKTSAFYYLNVYVVHGSAKTYDR